MGNIGQSLKSARENKNLSLKDIEDVTKIRYRYLEALEEEEFDKLPGRAYVIGFLKSYAKFLQIDANDLITEYKALYDNNENIEESIEINNSNKKKYFLKEPEKLFKYIGIIIITIIALFIVNYFYQTYSKEKNSIKPPANNVIAQKNADNNKKVENELDTSKSSESDNENNVPSNMENINVTVSVNDDKEINKCWIQVKSDEEEVFSGILNAGNSKSFVGKNKIWIKFGNAGVVKVSVNDKDQGIIGKTGEIKSLTFPIDKE